MKKAAILSLMLAASMSAVAQKAIPECNIVFIEGAEMKTIAEGFLQVLYDADPAAVGGAVPAADFYYNAE